MIKLREKCGKHYQYGKISYYAVNGMICWIDEGNDGECRYLSRRDFIEKAYYLNASLAPFQANGKRNGYAQDELLYLGRVVQEMIECAKEAKEQGDRFDPEVDAWFQRHKPDFKSSVSFAEGPALLGQDRVVYESAPLPAPNPGRFTGRMAFPDYREGGQATPSLVLPFVTRG